MPWETRQWATTPNEEVLKLARGLRLMGKPIRVTLDPRAFDTDDANELRIDGIYVGCQSNGPTLMFRRADGDPIETLPLIDVLLIEDRSEVTA